MWFSRDQLKQFKRGNSVTLNQIKSESHCDMFQYVTDHIGDSDIFMGLEPFLNDSTALKIAISRRNHTRAVLIELNRQIDAGIVDHDEMARVSMKHSHSSRKRAMIIA